MRRAPIRRGGHVREWPLGGGPAFFLDSVKGADFFHVKAQLAREVPTFVLKNVEAFCIHQCPTVPDTKLERVEQRKLQQREAARRVQQRPRL